MTMTCFEGLSANAEGRSSRALQGLACPHSPKGRFFYFSKSLHMTHPKYYATLVLCCLTLATLTAQSTYEQRLRELLKSMSEADKVKVLQYAKDQSNTLDEQILRLVRDLSESGQAAVTEYALVLQGIQEPATHDHDSHDPATEALPADEVTTVSFEEAHYLFGTVREGQVVEHKYTFTNTGSQPYTIAKASGSCGCTVPEWPRNPIPPGGVGTVRVRFNTTQKVGKRTQVITLVGNTDPQVIKLTLSGEVVKDE